MANDGFIEFLSPNALSELKQAETLVNNLASSIEKINKFKAPISPSAADNAIKQQIADLKAQEQAIKKVSDIQRQIETNAKNQTSANQKLTKSEYDYVKSVERAIVAKEKAAKAAEREALGNEKLYSAYNELNAARTRAKNTLRDLIASQAASNSEIKKAQREFDNLDQKVRKADKAVGDFSKSVGNYKGALSGIGNLMGAFGISTGLYLAADLIKNIYETTKQLQSMDLALKMVSGSQDEFAKNQLFLTDLADQYGIEIKGLTKNFTEFWVASKGKLEAEKIKEIFTSISKSVAVMGLSVEQQDSAFLALQQMMSKGTVQAEELKKQLGNALPGAVKAATMAYQALHPELKVTEKIFMEQMKAGKILSAELLPELAKAYEKLYGIETVKRAETLAAAQNRLSNSWTTFIRSINESNSGALSTFFSLGTQAATGFLMILTRINDSWDTIYKKAEAKGTIDASNTFRNLMGSKEGEDAIKQAEQNIRIATSALDTTVEQLDELETQLKNINPWALNFFGPSPKDIKLQIEALKQQKAEYEGLLNLSKEFLKNQKKPAPKPVIADAGIGGKTKRKPDEKQINIQDKLLKNEYDLRIRELEIAKKVQEEIFNNEDKSYAERLAARDKFSKLSLQLLDLKNNREIEIEKDKANQLLKNQKEARDKDLKANAENVKNGFANKKVEIENRYAENVKTINYNLAQELLKININYLEETRDLQNVDLAFFKKIQEEKEKLTKETADIYFQMAQERRLKDSNDENRSLTQRQASFEAWKSMAEAQLFFDEALAKSNSNQSPEQIAKITAEFDKLRNSIKETISPLQKFAEETKNWLNDFSSSFASDAGFSQTFKIIEDDFFKNIDKAFKEGLITREEQYASYFNGITEMAQEAYNFLNEMSQQNFDAEYERLEEQKNVALLFAGDSEAAKAEIERQYEEKRKQIAKREAKAKKQQAIMNIAIDTAQAIVAAVAKSPLTGGLPWSAIAAAIGAAQIAIVSAQEIPEYWKGTDNAEGGLAWTQEKGREIITDSQGRVKSLGSDKGAELTMLSKGDKVFTAEKSAMMFDNGLNNMLLKNGIVMPKVEVSMDAEKITNEIKSLANTISNNETIQVVSDGVDIIMKLKRKNEIVERTNKRIDFKGKSV